MINPTTISEQLLFSTVLIKVNLSKDTKGEHLNFEENQQFDALGTGFFFNFKINEETFIPAIITNKHIVKGAITGEFQVHESHSREKPQPSGQFLSLIFDDFEKRWIPHPDSEVDLCAMPFQPIIEETEKRGKSLFVIPLDESLIPSKSQLEELSAVEEVLMVGYPIGLSDRVNNFPLIRRGITATHPSVDYQGKSKGVIDAACFPGSSGSPVLIVNQGFYGGKSGTVVGGTRAILLGVLHSGPFMTADGEIIIKEIPTAAKPISQTQLQIHLGYIAKAREIQVLGEYMKEVLKIK